MTPEDMTTKQLVAEFNSTVRVGDEVMVFLENGEVFQSKTRARAQVLASGQAVVWVQHVVGGFTLNANGDFVIAGLQPGPQVLRAEPLDDGDINSFFDSSFTVDLNFRVTFHDKVIAVPKGRILDEALPIIRAAGIVPEADFGDEASRKLRFATNQQHISLIRVRSFDVATFVAFGAAHLGIAGNDVLMEFDYPDIYAPLDLGIGKCRLSIAQAGQGDWGARAQRLLFMIEQGIPTYGNATE